MANYDNKLGEWYKQMERREQELKARKQAGPEKPAAPEAKQVTQTPRQAPAAPAERVVVQQPVASAPASAVMQAMETRTVVAEPVAKVEPIAVGKVEDFERTSEPREVQTIPAPRPSSAIFDDTDNSPVEDFLSFLDRTGDTQQAQATPTFPVVDRTRNRGIGHLSEGTGDPRPIIEESDLMIQLPKLDIEQKADVLEKLPEVKEIERVEEVEAKVEEVVVPKPKQARKIEPTESLQDKWDRMPHHLQTLFGVGAGEEVAQNSYKKFKESRGALIQRLLDPPLTLEEAARILNVCPTTVRRYTNKGTLKHFRTAGNQRRFRLSDVLTFMETKGRPLAGQEES